jgi:hypothetical protein
MLAPALFGLSGRRGNLCMPWPGAPQDWMEGTEKSVIPYCTHPNTGLAVTDWRAVVQSRRNFHRCRALY